MGGGLRRGEGVEDEWDVAKAYVVCKVSTVLLDL